VNIVSTVIQIVAPVFLLALIGFVWVKSGHEYRTEFATKLTMTLSVPALIFTSLVETQIDPTALKALSGAAITAYGALTLLMYLFCKAAKLEIRTYLNPLIFGNVGNLGLPVALFAFGEEGLSYAIVIFAVMAIWSFTFGLYVTAGGGSLIKVLKEPLLAATLLGSLFLWQGWTLPKFAMNSLSILGQLAIPLMLMTLGVAVARLKVVGLGRATLLSSIKVLLCAGVGAAAALLFQLPAVPFAIIILQISTPIAVTSYLMAEKYGANSDVVAGLVVTSTLLSVLYIPLLLAILI
jgi:predicted permease